ncbi:MAG: hypothetical protein OQK82_02465, partial [Candidatus Pacearchaeota archaeon]|nr:hypothetical protein [Candidatus Pacearchaeota archaeon]
MAAVLPHSAKIRADVESYLGDASALVLSATADLKNSSNYRAIYKAALATDAVLSKLSQRFTPRPVVARSVVQRVPILVGLAQLSAARVELRRLIEIVFWTVYFSDHPVEWRKFEASPSAGIESDPNQPISYNAHRAPSFYGNYAIELFSREPSGLVVQAVVDLKTEYGNLSGDVHAGVASTTNR